MGKIIDYEQVIELSGNEIFLVETPNGTRTMSYSQLLELIRETHNELIDSDFADTLKNLITSGQITLADLGFIADADHIDFNDESASLNATTVQGAIVNVNEKIPTEYLTNASVDGNTLTLDTKDGLSVIFTPPNPNDMELINSGTQTDAILNFIVNTDSDGDAFHLKKMKWVAEYSIFDSEIVFGALEVNGQGKDAFINVSQGVENSNDYSLQPLGTFPPDTFKAYGNTTDTITADKSLGCDIYQEYEFWLDDTNNLNATMLTRCYACDSEGTQYPVYQSLGNVTSFQKADFIQRCGYDFSSGIESFKMEFLNTTGRDFTWKLYGIKK